MAAVVPAVPGGSSNEELMEALLHLCRMVQRLVKCYEEGRESESLDSLIYSVERLYRVLLGLGTCSTDVLEAIGVSITLLQDLSTSQHVAYVCSYVPDTIIENSRGRPKLNITQEQLEYLLQLGFSCPKIALLLGVGLSTVRRRMADFGLSVKALYSSITDQELDSLVSQIKKNFPNAGFRLMHGHLLHQGHRISQARIREALHRVDPEGVAIRWSSAVQRRKYAVLAPLSLWHLDGNHKLIR